MVEYVKDPSSIDEAVLHVVDFVETQRQTNQGDPGYSKNRRAMRQVYSWEDEDSESEDNQLQPTRVCKETNKQDQREESPSNKAKRLSSDAASLGQLIDTLNERLDKLENNPTPSDNTAVNNTVTEQPGNNNRTPMKDVTCFACQRLGHFARNCPNQQATARRQHTTQATTNNYPAIRPEWRTARTWPKTQSRTSTTSSAFPLN
jgi:hypothetical protein